MVIDGRGKFRFEFEASSTGTIGHLTVYIENVLIELYDKNGNKSFTLEFKPSFYAELVLVSEVSSTGSEVKFSIKSTSRGNSSISNLKEKITQKIIFDNYKISLYPSSSTSEFNVEVSGKYSIATSPSWCGDGGFEVTTVKPLKLGEGSSCPKSGEIRLNNSDIKFEGENIQIDVSGQSAKYKCEELLKICPYLPLPSIYDILPGS